MHIVITRPKEDSFFLIERLKKLGHMVTHLPVIKIEGLKTKKINFQNYKAVIFTSSNAIKFLNVDKFDSKIKCYCVGKTTEFTARQSGFINTYSSEGTVDSLIELIIRSFENKSGKLLYLSSEFVSKDLDIDLSKAGFSIDKISSSRVKRRVIQNLFEAAASISYVVGLNKDEQALHDMMDPPARKVNFNAGVYVKVF